MKYKCLKAFIISGIVLLALFYFMSIPKVKVISSGITKNYFNSFSSDLNNEDESLYSTYSTIDSSEASRSIGRYINIVRLILHQESQKNL